MYVVFLIVTIVAITYSVVCYICKAMWDKLRRVKREMPVSYMVGRILKYSCFMYSSLESFRV